MNVVRCDGCGTTRGADIDHHGWLSVEVGEDFGHGGYNLDACTWLCLRTVAERLGDLIVTGRYISLGCALAVAVADVVEAHGPLDPALGAALAAWEQQMSDDREATK